VWLKSGSEGLVQVKLSHVVPAVEWRLVMDEGAVRSTSEKYADR